MKTPSQSLKRIVIKVGSSTLTTPEGRLDREFIAELSGRIAALRKDGLQTVLVTSGAVSAGADRLQIDRPRTMQNKQAAAAVGQGILMGVYAGCFDALGIPSAQILLTRQDVAERSRYTNASNTFEALFRLGAIPIVNENDSVAVDEIRFGDNDTLSAIVALIVDADLAVILSDVEGLLDFSNSPAPVVPLVREVTASVEGLASGRRSSAGTGGMAAKIQAARVLTRAGIPLVIGQGRNPCTIPGAVTRWNAWREGKDPGSPGTLFLPTPQKLRGRKRWIAFGSRARGALVVNERAQAALVEDGRSLLAAGIVEVSGHFAAGDLVRIQDAQGQEVGRGLVNYPVEEVRLICGRQSQELKDLLGRDSLPEVIHRDNLVVGV